MHGYAYGHNNPATYRDASGLRDCADNDCRRYAITKPGKHKPGKKKKRIFGGGPPKHRTGFAPPPPSPGGRLCFAATCNGRPVSPYRGPQLCPCQGPWLPYRQPPANPRPTEPNRCAIRLDRDCLGLPEQPAAPPPEKKNPVRLYPYAGVDLCFGVCGGIQVSEDGYQFVLSFGTPGVGASMGATSAPARDQQPVSLGLCGAFVVGPCGSMGERNGGGYWYGGGLAFGVGVQGGPTRSFNIPNWLVAASGGTVIPTPVRRTLHRAG